MTEWRVHGIIVQQLFAWIYNFGFIISSLYSAFDSTTCKQPFQKPTIRVRGDDDLEMVFAQNLS